MGAQAASWLLRNGDTVRPQLPDTGGVTGRFYVMLCLVTLADAADERDGVLPVFISDAELARRTGGYTQTVAAVKQALRRAGLLEDTGTRSERGAKVWHLRLDLLGCPVLELQEQLAEHRRQLQELTKQHTRKRGEQAGEPRFSGPPVSQRGGTAAAAARVPVTVIPQDTGAVPVTVPVTVPGAVPVTVPGAVPVTVPVTVIPQDEVDSELDPDSERERDTQGRSDGPGRSSSSAGDSLKAIAEKTEQGPDIRGVLRDLAQTRCTDTGSKAPVLELYRAAGEVAKLLPQLTASSPIEHLWVAARQVAHWVTRRQDLAPKHEHWQAVLHRYGPPLAAAGG